MPKALHAASVGYSLRRLTGGFGRSSTMLDVLLSIAKCPCLLAVGHFGRFGRPLSFLENRKYIAAACAGIRRSQSNQRSETVEAASRPQRPSRPNFKRCKHLALSADRRRIVRDRPARRAICSTPRECGGRLKRTPVLIYLGPISAKKVRGKTWRDLSLAKRGQKYLDRLDRLDRP
jgi:hypothetical protein